MTTTITWFRFVGQRCDQHYRSQHICHYCPACTADGGDHIGEASGV